MASSSSLQSKDKGKGPVHIPSTWSFWDLDSESEVESEEDGEVKEVLLPPEELIHSARRADNVGDNLAGAKARKVMGINTESCFEDSDDEEEQTAQHSSPSRTRSLRNPFKRAGSRLNQMGSGHRRGSITESDSESEQAKTSPRRRLSISGVVAPFFAQSPRMRASPSPISSTFTHFRSSQSSPTITSKRSLPATDDESIDHDMEIQWTRKLDDAAKAAKWQTSIEHRPMERRPPSSCGSISSRLLSPSPVLDIPQVALPSRLDDLPSPSLSPALSKRLSQIQQSQLISTTSQQHSSSAGYAPPRPPKSTRRSTKERPASVTPLSPPADDPHQVEYLNSKIDTRNEASRSRGSLSGTASPVSSRSSQRAPSRSGFTSPSLPRSTPRRQSNASSAASYDEQSPGLSQSSSTTHSSVTGTPKCTEKPTLAPLHSMFDLSQVHTQDHGVVSPFTKPRQAPRPPILDGGSRQGLGLQLQLNLGKGVEETKADSNTRPSLAREDSSLDPIMAVPPPERSDRPTSFPLSIPSVSSEEYQRASSDSHEAKDELLFALDRLDANLRLSDNYLQFPDDNDNNLARISEEMADYFEIPLDASIVDSAPKTCLASDDMHSSIRDAKPKVVSTDFPPIVPAWHKYTDATLCSSPDDSALDRDAILFLQHYDHL